MERLLVTGIDYPLGSNLALSLADRCNVLGVSSEHAITLEGMDTVYCEHGDAIGIERLLAEWRPQWILHSGPLSVPGWDAATTVAHVGNETKWVARLAESARDLASSLTVLSSDVVFAGPRMFHEEDSPVNRSCARAAAVRDMERVLESSRALVVRTHAYGWSPLEGHDGFAERAFEALCAGSTMPADGRGYATPILATDLAEPLWRAYELRARGLYHIAGAERTSRWGFVTELAQAMGLPSSRASAELASEATGDSHDETSLNCKCARRLLELGTPMLREGLSRFVAQAKNGWRDQLRLATTAREVAA